jgi:hypothetical protein
MLAYLMKNNRLSKTIYVEKDFSTIELYVESNLPCPIYETDKPIKKDESIVQKERYELISTTMNGNLIYEYKK